MSLRINTNISAINTHRNMGITDVALSRSLEKLSSGLRVNRASDDAAGLSISEDLRAQMRGLAQAERNAQDGISLINVAEGALNEMHSIVQRIRELTVQASNGTLTNTDRTSIQIEVSQLVAEVQNISRNTSFNGMKLLDGNFDPASTRYGGVTLTFQVGANNGQSLAVVLPQIDAESLNIGDDDGFNGGVAGDGIIDNPMDVSTQSNAMGWLAYMDTVIRRISTTRSSLGAISNRLEHTINNVAITRENLAAAESRIRDVDMANEMSTLTRHQILMQSGTAMLAQANSAPQSVLSLLR